MDLSDSVEYFGKNRQYLFDGVEIQGVDSRMQLVGVPAEFMHLIAFSHGFQLSGECLYFEKHKLVLDVVPARQKIVFQRFQ